MTSETKTREKITNWYLSRKPGTWEEVAYVPADPAQLEDIPVYGDNAIWRNWVQTLQSFDFKPAHSVFLIDVRSNGRRYLVNTEGSDYARYMLRVK